MDMINDSKTALILNISNNLINGFNCSLRNKEEIEDIISNFEERIPEINCRLKKNEVSYIIYTSGSIGKPNVKVNRKQLAEEL